MTPQYCRDPLGAKCYTAWNNLRARCTNPNHNRFHIYGGRGIGFCERWALFENFLADMGLPPSLKHSIERKDNNQNYCKKNCKWATYEEQANNTRTNRPITIDGVTKTISQWARAKGIRPGAVNLRIRRGWSLEDAVLRPIGFRPLRKDHSNAHYVTINEVTLTVTQWARKNGLNPVIAHTRIRRGWNEVDAVTRPLGKW